LTFPSVENTRSTDFGVGVASYATVQLTKGSLGFAAIAVCSTALISRQSFCPPDRVNFVAFEAFAEPHWAFVSACNAAALRATVEY